MVTSKGKKMFVDIAGEFTEAELEHKAMFSSVSLDSE